ncbi:MAG: hypothetical protein AAF945_14635 [Actinomycetota bacterium]
MRRRRPRYTRTADTTWRYESGPYDFALDTTDDGIVTRYGDDLWVARSVIVGEHRQSGSGK